MAEKSKNKDTKNNKIKTNIFVLQFIIIIVLLLEC